MSEFELNFNLMNQDDDNNRIRIHRLRHFAFLYSFLFLYIILVHISMPPKSKGPGSPTKKIAAKWNTQETEALISFLHSETDRLGNTSFKDTTFTAAANHIKDFHTDGPIKTAAHCKTKWQGVSDIFYFNDK